MNKATLVVMAAGIGSRFGGGIKQLEPVGPKGEIIMDYSIYDAIQAGFDKVVFVIRKDLEEDFRRIIGDRIEKICDVEYVFQSLDDICYEFDLSKPIWLDSNIHDFQLHAKTRFGQDQFIEHIEFDYLEIQVIEEDDE